MYLFPWIALLAGVVVVSVGLLVAWSRMSQRLRHTAAPAAVGLLSVVLIATALLLAVLAWGIWLKPR